MKKRKLLALALALAMTASLAACGGKAESSSNAPAATDNGTAPAASSADEIKDFVTYETTAREVEAFNVLYSQSATDFYVSTNLYDGLLTNDTKGALKENLAKEWGTENGGLDWTFKLRDDATWCTVSGEVKGNITSADFLTGLEWVLNAAKNDNANTSMPNDMIKDAKAYNDYTQKLVDDGKTEEALALTVADMQNFTTEDGVAHSVGIEAPDDYTVVYHCTSALPYFDTVATYACLYPAPQAQIDELGAEGFRGVQPEDIWYSGPYLLTTYINGNEKVFEQNPNWWGASEYSRFNSVTVKMVPDLQTAYQLYQTGEIDQIELTESSIATIQAAAGEELAMISEKLPSKYSYQMHFCFNKNNEDGTPDDNWNNAIANENFRKALYYGIDFSKYYARINPINPLKVENNFYTMKGLVYTSDGKDYTDLVKAELGLGDFNGETMVRYDAAKAADCIAKAKEELAAKGVTFPVQIAYYISGSSQTALDSATVLKQTIENSLGSDFVQLEIKNYVSSLSKEVRTPKLASIYINGWGADYGDPENYLFQETFGDENAYYSQVYSRINDFYADPSTAYDETLIAEYQEFTKMVEEANAIVENLDERYAAYAKAEAYMLDHCLGGIPLYYSIVWQETKVNDYSTINAAYGIQARRYLNWQTNVNGYSGADYDAFAAEYNK